MRHPHAHITLHIHKHTLSLPYTQQTAPDWVQAPQATLYSSPEASPQPYAAVPQYPVAPPPPPPPPVAAAPSGGFPWYVWVGVGVFAANIGAKVCWRGLLLVVRGPTPQQLGV